MKMMNESKFIPSIDCPERLVKQSTLENVVATSWRKQVIEYWKMKDLEIKSAQNECAVHC